MADFIDQSATGQIQFGYTEEELGGATVASNRVVLFGKNDRRRQFRQNVGDVIGYGVDVTRLNESLGEVVSSATWSVDNGSAAVSNVTLTELRTTALVSTSSQGKVRIKVTLTGATQTSVQYIRINVYDPSDSTTDYQ